MSDYTKLQARCQRGEGRITDANNLLAECYGALGRLIAENEQLAKTSDCWDRLNIQNKALSDSFRAERDQLKAENEALRSAGAGALRFVAFAFDEGVEGAEQAGRAIENAIGAKS